MDVNTLVEKNGYAKVNCFMPTKLLSLVEETINEYRPFTDTKEDFLKFADIVDSLLNSEEVKKIINDKNFHEQITELLGVKKVESIIFSSRVNFRGENTLEFPWHQDRFIVDEDNKLFTFWTPLCDVNYGTGGLAYAVNSHKKGKVSHEEFYETNQFIITDIKPHLSEGVKYITAKKGESVVIDESLIHCSTKNTEKFNRWVVMLFVYVS